MPNLIQHTYQNTPVLFQSDAFLNATCIAKKFDKKPNDYLKIESTQNYIKAIAKKIDFEENQVVIAKKGSPGNGGGTWLHPKLSIDFARWLDADFAVWCDEQIENIMKGNTQPQPPKKTVTISLDTIAKDDRYLVSSNNGTLRLFPLHKDVMFLRRDEIVKSIHTLAPEHRLITAKLYNQLTALQKQIESINQ